MGLLDARQAGDDAGARSLLKRVADLSQQQQMAAASLGGIQGLIDSQALLATQQGQLAAQQAQLQAQVDFLLTQTVFDERWNIPQTEGVGKITTSPAASSVPDTWLPWNASYDAAVTVSTSSTGSLMVQLSGGVWAESLGAATAIAFIGLEILQAGTVIDTPSSGDGPNIAIRSGTATTDLNRLELLGPGAHYLTDKYSPLTPLTTYTLRCRRGYAVGAGLATNRTAYCGWSGTAISVTKLGM